MKAIILAAGFSQRLYPYIGRFPKTLLPIAGSTLLDIIMRKICEIKEIDEVFVITNGLYFDDFQKWGKNHHFTKSINLISNGISKIEKKKGAIGDLNYVIGEAAIGDELLVVAGDNYFEFNLRDFINRYQSFNKSIIAVCDLGDLEKLSGKFGMVKVDADNKIIDFQEKPKTPSSSLASTLCYLLHKTEISTINQFINNNPEADDTGVFIRYLIENNHVVYAYIFNERWCDIGDYQQYLMLKESLEK
jgi:glucose-1-phosphate thymidylyltransferase